jgi:hypothetical protein
MNIMIGKNHEYHGKCIKMIENDDDYYQANSWVFLGKVHKPIG